MAIVTSTNSIHPEAALTSNTKINNGSHILYVSSDPEKYIENAVVFISAGFKLNQIILFVDDPEIYSIILKRLTQLGYTEEQLGSIIFANHDEFYHTNDIFDSDRVFQTFENLIGPFLHKNVPIRHWGKVKWLKGQPDLLKKIKVYEIATDEYISKVNSFGVCAYDGMEMTASLHMEMMKYHQYIMSDTNFVTSSFYEKEKQAPSIRMEAKYEEKIINLQNQEFHYKHLLDVMPDAVFISYNESIVYGNRAFFKLLECEPKSLIGKKTLELAHSSFYKKMKASMNGLKDEDQPSPIEGKLVSFSGKSIDIEALSFPFVFQELSDTIITIVRDIKERKDNEKLEIRNGKLSIAGQLAASIAHEVRNPLTTIKGFLKLSQEGSLDLDVYSIIDEEIARIETIASELLVLGKPLSTTLKEADVGKILRNICTLMQSQANMENVSIQLTEMEKNLFILCNEDQIKQVFINIIKNAIEAMEAGGKIRIKAFREFDEVIIEIVDDGKGIPDHIKNKLGEPFYSTKEKGTGLGMMVCYNIIEQHEGQIEFNSTEGQGTTFTIKLPLV
ncbi:ATP-binding protein [Litchfieldia salsa]|uniref:histidine kinase n=1 Tax=Litchfieldia salsa TaxID=930152 RepID=A0A1H0W4R0_9BACI|nr:ATP-binding protein [Litchfieldia salsa]SDP85306.1 two-component system, sporulation sensor kinase A [Litchfieldia salsa]